jgi:hypothetical protein
MDTFELAKKKGKIDGNLLKKLGLGAEIAEDQAGEDGGDIEKLIEAEQKKTDEWKQKISEEKDEETKDGLQK